MVILEVLFGRIPGKGDGDNPVVGITGGREILPEPGEDGVGVISPDTAEEGNAAAVGEDRKIPGLVAAICGHDVLNADVRIGETLSNALDKLVEGTAFVFGMSILSDKIDGEIAVHIVAGADVNKITGSFSGAGVDKIGWFIRVGGISPLSTVDGKHAEPGEIRGREPVILVNEQVEEVREEIEGDLVTDLTEGGLGRDVGGIEPVGVDKFCMDVTAHKAEHNPNTVRDSQLSIRLPAGELVVSLAIVLGRAMGVNPVFVLGGHLLKMVQNEGADSEGEGIGAGGGRIIIRSSGLRISRSSSRSPSGARAGSSGNASHGRHPPDRNTSPWGPRR